MPTAVGWGEDEAMQWRSSRSAGPNLRRRLLGGALAGAAGTVALNVVTYLDMAARGRSASKTPAKTAGELSRRAGIDLAATNDKDADKKTARNRRQALGALLGYVTGVGVGMAYGAARPRLGAVAPPVAATGLGLAAMAGSDVPATALGVTDPRQWSMSSWASDIVPHLAYGLVVASAYDAVHAT